MPKHAESRVGKMRSFATEYEQDTLVYEKSSLLCRCCGIVLGTLDSEMKRSQVKQHINTAKHSKNFDLHAKQSSLNFTVDSFNTDLCRVSFVSSVSFKHSRLYRSEIPYLYIHLIE